MCRATDHGFYCGGDRGVPCHRSGVFSWRSSWCASATHQGYVQFLDKVVDVLPVVVRQGSGPDVQKTVVFSSCSSSTRSYMPVNATTGAVLGHCR